MKVENYRAELAALIAADMRVSASRDTRHAVNDQHIFAASSIAADLKVLGRELRHRLRFGLRPEEDMALIADYVKTIERLKWALSALAPVASGAIAGIMDAAQVLQIEIIAAIPVSGHA